jgi:hypothetical protein
MNKKNIFALMLISSLLFAQKDSNLVPLKTETSEEEDITLDFSFGLNEPNKAAFVPRASSNNLYNEINKNWQEITKVLKPILMTNILPLGLQMSHLSNLLKTDEKFQTLVKTNAEKIVKFAIPLIGEVVDEAAKVAGYQKTETVKKD